MKNFRRMLCLLLVLLTLAALVPAAAFAAEGEGGSGDSTEPPAPPSKEIRIKIVNKKKTLETQKMTISDKDVTLKPEEYITISKKVYEFAGYELSGKTQKSITIPAYDKDKDTEWTKAWDNTISLLYDVHKHRYYSGYNRTHHWKICDCGSTTNAVLHVDPAEDEDKVCTCGYVFSNNTQLTTLWMTNVRFDQPFNKEIRDYTAKVVDYGYNDTSTTIITATPFDALAKLTMPEGRELHDGVTRFEFHLLAEDRTTTGTYTVTVLKPVKVGKNFVYSDGATVHTEIKAPVKNKTAFVEVDPDVSAKMLELTIDGVDSVLFRTKYSKWSILQLDLTLPASFFTALAENGKADLKVETPYGTTLTIPNGDLTALAEGRESLTIRIGKDNSFAIVSGEESLPLSEKVKLDIPEAK